MLRGTKKRGRRARRPEQIIKLPAPYFEALDLGNLLFPPLYQFENGLRVLLDGYLKTCYGTNWWDVSLRAKLPTVFDYAENQKKKLDAMPWIGDSTVVTVLPVHLVTLGHLEEIVKAYQSDCIPELFPNMHFFLGHMELIKRVRNMYSHMFPCITRDDCRDTRSEIRILARHINSKLA
jgi:hypothetical protein